MNRNDDYFYSRTMFFAELSQSIERKKLSTNDLFTNFLNDFNNIVHHNGLVQEEMNIVCTLLCTVDLRLSNFRKILLTLVPEEPFIPSNVCEELIIWALSVYWQNEDYEIKAQYILFWLLYIIEEKLTDLDVIDKYYKIIFHLGNYGRLTQPVAGIIYYLTKPDDVQKWMITYCTNHIEQFKSDQYMDKLLNFLKNPDTVYEPRKKGLYDKNAQFFRDLAASLRSVRKELTNINQSAQSQQLIEYGKKRSCETYSKIQFVNVNKKFDLPSAPDLAKAFMRHDISNNSLSLLGNVSGWCKLLMNTDKELNLQHRFSNNLHYSLNQIFLSGEITVPPSKKSKFLLEILEFQKFAQRGLAVINIFIFEYILSWDGMDNARIIYELFEYLSFSSEEELKNRFLEKLYAIFITGDELIYRMVINSLTNLLCNMYLNARINRTDKNCILFGEKLRNETLFEIVKCLTKYISYWCSLCIYHYPHEEQLKNVVYTFYEKVSVLENLKPYTNNWPLWTIMPPNVFYNGLMSVNIHWLDRLAKLMLRHINCDMSRIEECIVDTPCLLNTSLKFNMFMADLYNALKTGKLFDNREEGFIFKHLSKEEVLTDLNLVNLNLCFKLEKHIALAPYYMNFKNKAKDPSEILAEEAPNLKNLINVLHENLVDGDESMSD
ncbi:Centromere protein I [Cinara cedri]|uniref:Centromere protein I n=1 Tax=Cinara cedri TaxID=506608 RepID=A0A5E4N6D5_9HEMI|nr:Centromere protein I [Cinara cedri]